jgi:predicted transcriptional regulator
MIQIYLRRFKLILTTLVNTQNVSITKIVDSSSIQCAESKYGLRIQFLALVVMIHEV